LPISIKAWRSKEVGVQPNHLGGRGGGKGTGRSSEMKPGNRDRSKSKDKSSDKRDWEHCSHEKVKQFEFV